MMFKWIFNYFKPKKEMVICTLLFHFFNCTSKGTTTIKKDAPSQRTTSFTIKLKTIGAVHADQQLPLPNIHCKKVL